MPDIETRTQELGRELFRGLVSYRPTLAERVQDRLLALLMDDPDLRARLLRFVDVLAAFPSDGTGKRTAPLFREYFRRTFPRAPLFLRSSLALTSSPLVPNPVVRWMAVLATKTLARRFIVPPGESTVAHVIQELSRLGRYPSFDLLGEAVVSNAEALEYKQAYLGFLETLGNHSQREGLTAGGAPRLEVSLKLSSLTSQFNPSDPEGTLGRVRPPLEEICQRARERGVGVTIDAEQYATRDLGWYIFQEIMKPGEPLGRWPDAGMVVQTYLKDAQEHAREVGNFAHERGTPFRVRLVKGAYWDYEVITAEQNGWPVPVFRDKGATDQTFESVLRSFLEESPSVRVAVGSHNIRAHAYGEAVREALGLPAGTVEHQTLYRTLEGLSQALAGAGWVTRDYVPVGELVPGMAYLVRRVLENTSQVGFLAMSRTGMEESALLAPPHFLGEDSAYRRRPDATGFSNTSPVRLFDAQERLGFQRALEETRSGWGATYPLQLGAEQKETSQCTRSNSPSYPGAEMPVGWVHRAGVEEVEKAVGIANEAFASWASRPASARGGVGLRAAELLRADRDKLAAWVVHEGGRTWQEALADVDEAIDHVEWNARQLLAMASLVDSEYRARGVVACIAPWNFPTALPAGMVSGALMAGNAVILKSADATPVTAHFLTEAFHRAGVPKEVLIHLPGSGRTVGSYLVESADVDMVAFTGSKEVGVSIYRTASSVTLRRGGIKRVVAEMGGKNAIVVFPDVDMDEAVQGILHSAFSHAGQKCSACSRVFVHQDVRDVLVRRLIEGARSLPIGLADEPSTFINPVINEEAYRRILSYRDVALQEGSVLLDAFESGPRGSLCLGPLIVEIPAERAGSARLAQEEIFGPVLTVIPFRSLKQAIALVNDSIYGIGLGVYSRSPATLDRIVPACRVGNVYVNRGITGARVGIEPFGGFQLSGTGLKAGSREYFMAFMSRREPLRGHSTGWEQSSAGKPAPFLPGGWRTWEQERIEKRLSSLRAAVRRLQSHCLADLESAVSSWKSIPADEALVEASRIPEMASEVLDNAREVSEPEPTVQIPGQENFCTWSTPRGLGLVAVDGEAEPRSLAALIFGALLAGNGVLVAAPGDSLKVARVIAQAAWESGVPADVLCLAPSGVSPEAVAVGPIHFAAIDLCLDRTRSLYRLLGETREERGQRWLKFLISINEGPGPGEPGFLRLFALPKTVAIRTLRHGADLRLT